MSTPVGVCVTGAGGRMGAAVIRAVCATPGLQLAALTERQGSPAVGQPASFLARADAPDVRAVDGLEKALEGGAVRVVIDFTSPEATKRHAELCGARGVALVIGTTGLLKAERAVIEEAAKKVPVVLAPNMSVGVNVLFMMAGQLAKALGEDYDIEVLEAHHRMKKDAPSGTALRLGEVLAEARGGNAPLKRGRDGLVGERTHEEIGMAVLRGGDVVGEHTVFFYGEGERIELTHRATSRDQFARGAVRAARWVVEQKPGLYDMQDVLGLRGQR